MNLGTDAGFTIFMIAFVVIGLPVILGIGSEMWKRWLTHKERMAEALAAGATVRAELLEERVRVLERIATDRGQDLTDQIERLREPRAVN